MNPLIHQGQTFGKLTALEDGFRVRHYVELRCECGNTHRSTVRHLLDGNCTHCGCTPKPRSKVRAGDVFTRLTVLTDPRQGKVQVRCQCGTEMVVTTSHLVTANTKSCGCLKRDISALLGAKRMKHGHATRNGPSATYRSFESMNRRVRYPATNGFSYYGGRPDSEGGPVTVCKRYRFFEPDAFFHFLLDCGERPDDMVLSRIDDALGYWCGFCEECQANGQVANLTPWDTRHGNIRNRRNKGRYGGDTRSQAFRAKKSNSSVK